MPLVEIIKLFVHLKMHLGAKKMFIEFHKVIYSSIIVIIKKNLATLTPGILSINAQIEENFNRCFLYRPKESVVNGLAQ